MVRIEPATAQGQLYELPYGFPGLCVDQTRIQATGTTDYLADTRRQYAPSTDTTFPSGDLCTVHGEVLTFDDPLSRLPTLDALEGYTPVQPSFYGRALYPVTVSGGTILAWLYHIPRPTGDRLTGGRWPT